MEVIAGDLLKDVGLTCVDRHLLGNGVGQWPGAFAIDENAAEPIAGSNRPLDHDVALGDEEPGHVAVGSFPLLAQDVIPQALKNFNSRVVGVTNNVAHRSPSSS